MNNQKIFKWSCDNESNSASCFFVGKNYLEMSETKLGLNYLQRSCDLKYGLGCWELGAYYEKMGNLLLAKKFKDKGCKLDIKDLCALRNK